MKALFIKCNKHLTVDMLVGALINMGVPEVYLKSESQALELAINPIVKNNPRAQIGTHYFYLPPMNAGSVTFDTMHSFWQELCKKGYPEYLEFGQRVLQTLEEGMKTAGASNLSAMGVTFENLVSLYFVCLGLSYLEVESIFTYPLDIDQGTTAAGKLISILLKRQGSTVGLPIPPEEITPFVAAVLEGVSEDFTPIDGRFIVDATSYGSDSIENPKGENTVTLYLGYYKDNSSSIFGKHLQVFGK